MKIQEYILDNDIDFNYLSTIEARCDLKILNYLKNIENGVFFEAGAHDGVFQSNTKILEDCGWTGLLVEPSNVLFECCKINRKCNIEHYALVSDDYNENTIEGDYDGDLISSGTGITLMGIKTNELICPAISFNNLNKKYGYQKIDFFSLDVEGYEMEILNGINFDMVDISYLLVEVNYKKFSLEDLNNFLLPKGYKEPINISNFTIENCPTWPGTHQDFLYIKK
jgi:FkbM family methyltransferase